jgi:hypothetical protein
MTVAWKMVGLAKLMMFEFYSLLPIRLVLRMRKAEEERKARLGVCSNSYRREEVHVHIQLEE